MFSKLLEKIMEGDKKELFTPYSPEEIVQKRLKNCIKNPDGTYSSEGVVDLSNLGLEKLPVKFKEVGRGFYCNSNKLTSLEGAPKEVGGDF